MSNYKIKEEMKAVEKERASRHVLTPLEFLYFVAQGWIYVVEE